ncbi:MAG: PaaI family thioesterase [Oscillibacter sp.]|nr:PaaI family thioesterase [Oscillibacter sp.]
MRTKEEHLEELKLNPNSFSDHNFYELETLEPDHAVCLLDIRKESLNPYGMVHGGNLYALADEAAGTAAHSDGRHYVTQNGTLNFLNNRPRGIIRAEAKVRHRGRSTVLIDVEIRSEDAALLATGTFIYFRVDKSRMNERAAE